MNERLWAIEQELNVDANMYDSTISALFTRVSDILNELIKKASSVTSNDEIVLSNVVVDNESVPEHILFLQAVIPGHQAREASLFQLPCIFDVVIYRSWGVQHRPAQKFS